MTLPTLRTERLVLRALHESDLDAVVRHVGDYEVSKWLVPVAHPYTYADAEDFLAEDRAGTLGMLWAIVVEDELIGVISIGMELGYWLGRDHWGKGYMSEAVSVALRHVFRETDIEIIRSSHFNGNHGSQRVLEKNGFVDVGGHIHYSKARQAEVAGRRMELTRRRWDMLQNG